jgi:pimeloyl-ACP methyl ester carboxylesterase
MKMPIISLDYLKLHYEVMGEGDRILFLHGLGSSGRDWQEQTSFFANRYQVITVDMRGHGESNNPPGAYSIPLFAEDVARLLEVLRTPPVHTVGISMGGMIAFQLAVSNPELVRSLVIVNSSPEFVVRSFKEGSVEQAPLSKTRTGGIEKDTGRALGGKRHPCIRKIYESNRWLERGRSHWRYPLPDVGHCLR